MARLDVYAVLMTPAAPIALGPPELYYNIERATVQLEAGMVGEFAHMRNPQLSGSHLYLVMATRGETASFDIFCHKSAARPSIRPPSVQRCPSDERIEWPEPMTLYITGRVIHRGRRPTGHEVFLLPFVPERADIDDPDWFYRAADYYSEQADEHRADILRETARALEALYSTSPGLIRYAGRPRR